jgi:hypothetical protein
MFGEDFRAGEQQILERLAADELMNAVVHDSLFWVVPERREWIVDDDDRGHAALALNPMDADLRRIGLTRLRCSR